MDFLVVLVAALLATVFSQKVGIPPVIGLIFSGVLIGPSFLSLVHETEIINLFAEMGAVLLLFYIGIEFDFPKLLRVAVKSVFFAILKILIVFVIIYEVALYAGLDTLTALLLGFLLSITSTAIMVQILEQKGLSKKPIVSVLITALIIEDIIAVAAITFVSSLEKTALGFREAILSIAFSIIILGVAYFALKRILEFVSTFLRFDEHEDSLLFFSLTLCSALSLFAFWIGLTPAIGAFLAGSLVSSLKVGHKAREITNPLGLAFSAVFFISIGIITNAVSVIANLPLFSVLLAVHLIAIVFAVYLASRLIGFNQQDASLSAFSMVVVGEFSLLFAKEAAAFSSIDLVGLASLSVLSTAIISSLFVHKSEKLLWFVNYVPPSAKRNFQALFSFTTRVIDSLEYAGRLHRVLLRELVDRQNDLVKIIVAGAVLLVMNFFFSSLSVSFWGFTFSVFRIFSFFLILVIIYSVLKVFSSILHLLDVFEESVLGSHSAGVRHFEINLGFALTLLALGVFFPLVLEYLALPTQFRFLQLFILVLGFVFLWIAAKNLPVFKTTKA